VSGDKPSVDRHILITGGAGYIGSLFVGALLQRGNWVMAVDDLLFGVESLLAYLPYPMFHFVRADVCETGVLFNTAHEAEVCGASPVSAVVHLSAIAGFPACQEVGRDIACRTNVDAVRRVFYNADDLGVDRLRFDLIINQFVLEAFTRGELLIYQGEYSRSFVHIRDVVAGLLLGLEAPEDKVRGQIYNLGDEQGNYSKDEIVSLIRMQLPKIRVNYKDFEFSGDMRDIRVSFEKIRNHLGFEVKWTVEQGIQEIMYLLQKGLIKDPYAAHFRNANFIVQ